MGCLYSSQKYESSVITRRQINNIENIVFSGGGSNGIVHVGGYKALWEHNIVQTANRFAGTSVGSIFASLAALKIHPQHMIDEVMATNFSTFEDGWCPGIRLICCKGFYKGNTIHSWFSKLLKKYGGSENLTFGELYEKNKSELTIVACNLDDLKIEYFNFNTHHDMKIADAVRCSISVPFEFVPATYNNKLHIDGGFGNNYPIGIYDIHGKIGNTIGLRIFHPKEENKDGQFKLGFPIKNIKDYTSAVMLFNAAICEKENIEDTKLYWERTIRLSSAGKNTVDFKFTKKEKINFIESSHDESIIAIESLLLV